MPINDPSGNMWGMQDYPGLMSMFGRLPQEVRDRVGPLVGLAAQSGDDRIAALGSLDQYGQGLQQNAANLTQGVQQLIQKPLPIDPALMGLNRAMGSFSQMLSPQGGFRQRADDRRLFMIGQMKEQRLEQIRQQEQMAMEESKRAEEFGDKVAQEKALGKAEKLNGMRAAMGAGLEGYYAAKDKQNLQVLEHRDKMDEIVQAEVAKTVYGGVMPPQMKETLAGLDQKYRADNRGLDIQLEGTKDIIDEKKRASSVAQLMSQKAQIAQDYLMSRQQVMGTGPAPVSGPQPDPAPITERARGVLGKYIQNGHISPPQIMKDVEDATSTPNDPIWKDMGIDPNTPGAQQQVRNLMGQVARTVLPSIKKDMSRAQYLRSQIEDITRINQLGGEGPYRNAKPLIDEYNQIQRRLRSYGLASEGGQPGMMIN